VEALQSVRRTNALVVCVREGIETLDDKFTARRESCRRRRSCIALRSEKPKKLVDRQLLPWLMRRSA
jgi:hypothetical protein